MKNELRTILVVGDAPRLIGFYMVRKLLDAGYKVKAPNTFAHGMDGNLKGNLSQMDFFGGFGSPLKENDNFTEIEYNSDNERNLKEIISGCYAVIYLSSVLCDYRQGISTNTDGLISQKALMLLADISKACRVHHFLNITIPVMYSNENNAHITENIQIKEAIDYYSKYHELCKEYLGKIAVDQFFINIIQLGILSRDFHQRRLNFNITTITNHIISRSKTSILCGSKGHVSTIANFKTDASCEKGGGYTSAFHVNGIIDLCLFILEYSDNINKKNWLCRVMYKCVLEHFNFGRYLVDYLRNPRVPLLEKTKSKARSLKRLFDLSMMICLLHVWPEQVYRFSTRKLLPNKSERFNVNDKPTIPFELIRGRTSGIKKIEEINVVMRGSSFDISRLDNLEGPTYLVNFSCPIETQKDVIYIEQSIPHTYTMHQLGLSVCFVEVNRVAENGEKCIPESYLNLSWYEELFNKPNVRRISIAERICRPFKLPLTSSWRPAGAGLNAICALSYFADKINIYGWDFYLETSPDDMNYRELFSNLIKFRLDIRRSRLHFECAMINFYYGYHLSKLPNINNYGYMGQLDRHEKLIKKIERVLFN